MARKTPTVSGRGVELLPSDFRALDSKLAMQAQIIAARFALPLETAATVAALAFGAAHHG